MASPQASRLLITATSQEYATPSNSAHGVAQRSKITDGIQRHVSGQLIADVQEKLEMPPTATTRTNHSVNRLLLSLTYHIGYTGDMLVLLCSTEASLRQVRSAMSSTLLKCGGFIRCTSSLDSVTFLWLSVSSTSTSSPRSSRMLADWGWKHGEIYQRQNDGTHTSLLAAQSAWLAPENMGLEVGDPGGAPPDARKWGPVLNPAFTIPVTPTRRWVWIHVDKRVATTQLPIQAGLTSKLVLQQLELPKPDCSTP
ncbi:hypothetical protein EYF80_008668 [Liparis tanakae]|uniref:Uncharacterized protein n=1 Tax=Liparis tanakae TaxID=230148 RepID=A0A4Z2IUP0_9TELE|nr:hypothetical protein EYF80_008668 [Liparis tanakae]